MHCSRRGWLGWAAAAAALLLGATGSACADDAAIDMGDVTFKAPEKWVKKQPKSSIVQYEFHAPKAEGDEADGRLTVMAAGGGIDANINRWIGQFTQPDGKDTKDRAKISKKKVGAVEVHLVDIAGTFKDSPGPFAPGVDRERYRMLAAIVVPPKGQQIFLKFYGPQKTIAEQEAAFASLVDNVQSK